MLEETIIKAYRSKMEADEDSYKMREQGYSWVTGWYTVNGFSVEYKKQ